MQITLQDWQNEELHNSGVGQYDAATNMFRTPDGKTLTVDQASALQNQYDASTPNRQGYRDQIFSNLNQNNVDLLNTPPSNIMLGGGAKAQTFDPRTILGPMASGFTDLTGTVNSGFTDLTGTVNSGFGAIGTDLNTLNDNNKGGFESMLGQFNAAADARTAMQNAILNSNNTLANTMDGMGAKQDTYFSTLADGQAGMGNQMSTLQSGQTDFRRAFDEQSTIANRNAGDLASTVAGGFQQTNEKFGSLSGGPAAAANVAPTAAASPSQVPGSAPAGTDFASVARALATGQVDQQMAPQAQAFSGAINAMRQFSMNPQIDPNIRAAFADVGSAFDQTGRLVPTQVDQNGMRTARAIDQNGALAVRQMDATGATVRQQSYNLNQLISMFTR